MLDKDVLTLLTHIQVHALIHITEAKLQALNPISGRGVQICTPLPRYDFTFNIIILDIFCENLAYIAPPLQIL